MAHMVLRYSLGAKSSQTDHPISVSIDYANVKIGNNSIPLKFNSSSMVICILTRVVTFTGIPTITSITYITESFKAAALKLMHRQDHKTFISIEPILGMLIPEAISFADHVFVGAMTGTKAKPTELSWINEFQHPNIHFKDNILKYIQ